MTYDEIKTAAFAYLQRERASVHSTIEAHIESGNEEFFSHMSAENKSLFIDNLILDYFCFNVVQDVWAYDLSDTKKVYEAAKIMFARHPNKSFTRDLDSAADIFGSPWAVECASPELWAIHFAALGMQNDEASISGPITEELVKQGKETVQGLLDMGIPRDLIEANVGELCWGRYSLRNDIARWFNFKLYVPTADEVEEEESWLEVA